jgi:hypothetical protein
MLAHNAIEKCKGWLRDVKKFSPQPLYPPLLYLLNVLYIFGVISANKIKAILP